MQVWDVECSSLIYVYSYCGRFDTIDFLFCNLRKLNGFISVGIGAIHTAKT